MMTLDMFQKAMESIAAKFKVEMMNLLEKGVKNNLDQELMLVIITREMEKLDK